MQINSLINRLHHKQDLSTAEATYIMEQMVAGVHSTDQIADILTLLHNKGETAQEILGFLKVMKRHMRKIKTNGIVIDTAGTGGDGLQTFNISTAVALVAAGAGLRVAKHGNRNFSSKCGSADVLESLGVNILLEPTEAENVLKKVGMVFLFAPIYHPYMKHINTVRKQLGQRTIFNYLGPLVNPAQVKNQIIGVSNQKVAQTIAQLYAEMLTRGVDYEKIMIVYGDDGMDEISLTADTWLYELATGSFTKHLIKPEQLDFKPVQQSDIKGGDARENAQIIIDLLNGSLGPKRDIVLINTAYALSIVGAVETYAAGIKKAAATIDSGKALQVLQLLITESNTYGKHP